MNPTKDNFQSPVAESHEQFDALAFGKAIEAVLISGNPGNLDVVCRQTLACPASVETSQLLLIIAQTDLRMGRTKQIRGWLERLLSEASDTDILPAIAVAVRSGHAQLALDLYRRVSDASLPSGEQYLEIASDTITLAERLRQPRKHVSVWSTHRELLREACKLLERALPLLDSSDKRGQAWLRIGRARKLLGAPLSEVEQAQAEAAKLRTEHSQP
jgi:hypothetical protein